MMITTKKRFKCWNLDWKASC